MKVLFYASNRFERVTLNNAYNYYNALSDIYKELRTQNKHGRPVVRVEKLWDRFHEILSENNVNLDEVE